MKIFLLLLFPHLVTAQSIFEKMELNSNGIIIRADQSYIHFPDRPIIRAKFNCCGNNIYRLFWICKKSKYYFVDSENGLCFVKESDSGNIVAKYPISHYKITFFK